VSGFPGCWVSGFPARLSTLSGNDEFLDSIPLAWLFPDAPLDGFRSSTFTRSVPLRSANYDPADFTATLIPKRRLSSPVMGSIVVTQGSPAKTSAPRRDR
jgi:hypothetical protein